MGSPSTLRPLGLCVSLLASACSMPACGGADAPADRGTRARAQTREPERATTSGTDEPAELPTGVEPPPPASVVPDFASVEAAAGPTGRAIAELEPAECRAALRELAIPHQRSTDERARGVVAVPVVPTGPVGGITLTFEGRRALHRVMDCRLLLAIHAWAPLLRAAGVTHIRHLSAFRPGARVRATGQPSGHSKGLAFDPRFFERPGLETLDVLEDWQPRERGEPPCGPEPEEGQPRAPLPSPEEGQEAGAILRGMVCEAIRRELFQVVVTPHHDEAHANHVHVEVVPGVDWSWSG